MSHVTAFAISTLAQPLRGIHLLWNGPHPFLLAPGGWTIERRKSSPNDIRPRSVCDELRRDELERIRARLELRLTHGWMRLTEGVWPGPGPHFCEVFTLDLDSPATRVHGLFRGLHGLAIGLYHGKAVAFMYLLSALDGRNFGFGAAVVDQVILYGVRAQQIQICVGGPVDWHGDEIARVQVPLKEFDGGLAGPQDEFAAAKARLVDGESIDPARFAELADLLRVALSGPGRRPLDNLLRIANATSEPEEMPALDPLRTLLVSPKWRRVMGLSYVDHDPALVEGDSYDYRITGLYPKSETGARVYGFHTVPPGTLLPDRFLLDGCHFRVPTPLTVQAAPGIPAAADRWTTRLGIPLGPRNSLPWAGLGIGDLCLSVDLPEPVASLTLELEEGHSLSYTAGDPGGSMTASKPVPPGGRPVLHFPAPVTRVNLSGNGFLFALRPDAERGAEPEGLSVLLQNVHFGETPLPAEPQQVAAENLQRPDGPVLASASAGVPRLHLPGIRVRWLPAPSVAAPVWPSGLAVPQPLDAAVFEVERHAGANQPFAPVLTGEDNFMFGARGEVADDSVIRAGADLMELYPELPQSRGLGGELSYEDTFRAPDDANPAKRDAPPPGTMVRYRVRTLDAIGRPSTSWRESGDVRLEKHVPPPQPAAYDPTPADEMAGPDFTGVYAKVLVRGSPELTAEESAKLGAADNAILLRWGWHAAQRSQDPFATHFRVYLSRTFDESPAVIQSSVPVAGTPGDSTLQLSVPASVAANAAAGLSLSAGYPFYIVEHTGGTSITMVVRTRIPQADGSFRLPSPGPVRLPLKLSPRMTQPAGWDERFVFPSGATQLPIDADTQYEVVIPNRLFLSPEHPRDSLWVGVSSADSEPYVADSFPLPGPDGPHPGNESRIVALRCHGRLHVRPDFAPPPPAGSVPQILTMEPVAGASVLHRLDLAPHVAASGLATGALVQPERASISDLFGTLSVSGGHLMADAGPARGADRPPQALTLPNPGDQAAVVAAVLSGEGSDLEDRLAVRLAAQHPYAPSLFTLATPAPVPFAPFDQTLPADEARYLYRLRRADAEGRLSEGAAVANAVLRVPSQQPGATPRREPPEAGDPPERLRLRVPLDARLTHLLHFRRLRRPGAPTGAQLLRLGNRADLDPAETLRLRLEDGTVLAPEAMPLTSALQDADGWRVAVEPAGAAAGETIDLWAVTMTADRVPSPAGGPWRLFLPAAALTAPQLTVVPGGGSLDFAWTLPDPLITRSWLERSEDGKVWARASEVRRKPATGASVAADGVRRRYRVVAASQDGRRIESNEVEA